MNNKIKWLITIATLVICLVLLIVSLSDGFNRAADYDEMYGGEIVRSDCRFPISGGDVIYEF